MMKTLLRSFGGHIERWSCGVVILTCMISVVATSESALAADNGGSWDILWKEKSATRRGGVTDEAIQRCFKQLSHVGLGKHNHTKLWFFGNSVTRQHYFSARRLFQGTGPSVSVELQKAECGVGGSGARGRRPGQGDCYGICGCDYLGTPQAISFRWQQRLYDPLIEDAMLGKDPTTPVKPGDVVIMNVGLDDIAMYSDDREKGQNAAEEQLWQSTVEHGAPLLARRVLRAARERGVRAVFRTNTELCQERTEPCGLPSSTEACGSSRMWGLDVGLLQARINKTDAVLRHAMRDAGVPVIDMHAWARSGKPPRCTAAEPLGGPCACKGYRDNVHPGPALSMSHTAFFLKEACRQVLSTMR